MNNSSSDEGNGREGVVAGECVTVTKVYSAKNVGVYDKFPVIRWIACRVSLPVLSDRKTLIG